MYLFFVLAFASLSWSASPDPSTMDFIKSAAHYTGATYCSADSVKNWKCGAHCSDPATQGSQVIQYVDITPTDVVAIVAVNNAKQEIVVSFRGSETAMNWVEDFTFTQTTWIHNSTDGSDMKVHTGFLIAFETAKDKLYGLVKDTLLKNTGYSVLVSGHSLGAAIATLFAVHTRTVFNESGLLSTKLDLVTFGSPRVGDAAFSNYAISQIANGGGRMYRAVNGRDPVPHLPLEAMNFRHLTTEVWVNNDAPLQCNPSDSEDKSCSKSVKFVWQYKVEDHLTILGVDFGPSHCS